MSQPVKTMHLKKFHIFSLSLLIILSQLYGCSTDTPSLPLLGPDARILAFGNSLTHGTGAAPEESYPAILAELTGLEVINEGIPGEISADGLQRLPGVLDKTQPDLLILIHGGNDILRRLPRQETEQNLLAMIREARDRSIPVVMLAVPGMGLFLSPAPLYKKIARLENIPIDLDTLSEILKDPDRKSDQVHPNARGYADLAQSVFALLKRHGALQ